MNMNIYQLKLEYINTLSVQGARFNFRIGCTSLSGNSHAVAKEPSLQTCHSVCLSYVKSHNSLIWLVRQLQFYDNVFAYITLTGDQIIFYADL